MESFEVQGLWWLPEYADHQVPGVLSWDPARGGTLKLVGQLLPIVMLDNVLSDGQVQKYRDHDPERGGTYPVVHGLDGKSHYTLCNAFQMTMRDWSLERSVETVRVNSVLTGAFFSDPDIDVDTAVFRMRDLAGWVGASGVEVTHPLIRGDGDEFAVVSAKHLPEIVVPTAGPRPILSHRLEVLASGIDSTRIEQDWVLRLTQDDLAILPTFIAVASDFQDLVSVATGRTAEFRSLVLHHPELPRRSSAGEPMGNAREDLIYHCQWANRVNYEADGPKALVPMHRSEMYFTFNHVGVEATGRWLDVAADYRTELGRAMATRYSSGYLEDRIMNLCAALESFDKHRRDVKAVYVDRIEACVDLAGEVFRGWIIEDGRDWSKRVKKLRHELAHHGDQFRLDGSLGGSLIAEQLFWLFVICLFRVAQFPEAVFEAIAGHREWNWLQEQVRESLALSDVAT